MAEEFDDIYAIIRGYAGTSMTKGILSDIKFWGKILKRKKYVVMGDYVFTVSLECTCDLKCGGIFCKPLRVFELVGLKQEVKSRE